jgi:hypothetical protein
MNQHVRELISSTWQLYTLSQLSAHSDPSSPISSPKPKEVDTHEIAKRGFQRLTCSASVAQHGFAPFIGSGHPHWLVNTGIGSVCGLWLLVLRQDGSVADGVIDTKVVFGDSVTLAVGSGMERKVVVLRDVTLGSVSMGSDVAASSSSCGWG